MQQICGNGSQNVKSKIKNLLNIDVLKTLKPELHIRYIFITKSHAESKNKMKATSISKDEVCNSSD